MFDHVWNGEGSPSEVVEKHGLKQVTDTGAIEKAIDEIIAANPDKAEAVKDKPQALGWFVGQVMKATGGKANPAAVNEILKAKLFQIEEDKRRAESDRAYSEKGDIAWGNQIRSYVFQPYQKVLDLRTGHESGNIQHVMDGDIDAFIEAKLRGKVRVKGAKDEED